MQIAENHNGTITLTVNKHELDAIGNATKELSEGVGPWNPKELKEISDDISDWFLYKQLADKFSLRPAFRKRADAVKALFGRMLTTR